MTTAKFVLEVTVDPERPAEELGRALRYWGGNLHHYDLKPGDGSAIYDSVHREVGHWRIEATG
ncbi:hypothetical protein ACVNF4_10410 [Streptomyces sp. S6]